MAYKQNIARGTSDPYQSLGESGLIGPFKKKIKPKKRVYGQTKRKELTSQQERRRAILAGVIGGTSPFWAPEAPKKIMTGVGKGVKKLVEFVRRIG